MTPKTTEPLKPCPFCGYDQPEPAVLKDGARIVRCHVCGARSGRFYNLGGSRQASTRAAQAWNRREGRTDK